MQPNPTDTPEPFRHYPVPPELLAWAQQTLDLDEIEAEIREMQTTGGRSFEELIAELDAETNRP